MSYKTCYRDFPGGAVVKNLPANAGNTDSSPPDCGESGWKLLPRRAGPLFSRVPLRSFLPELKYRGEGTGEEEALQCGPGNGEHQKVIVN